MSGLSNRRQLLSLLATASSASLLVPKSVCAAQGISTDHILQSIKRLPGDKPKQLKLLAPDGAQANLAPIIEKFHQSTGISVEIQLTPVDDVNTQLLLDQLSGAESCDLAVVATFGIPDLVTANALLPIDKLEERFPFARQSRQRGLYQLGDSFDGQTYGPQVDGDLYVIFYNNHIMQDPQFVERFEASTGRAPAPAETWAELDQLMRIANQPAQRRYGGLLFRTPRYIVWEFWSRMHAAGVLPFDTDMRPQLTDSRCVAAVEALISTSANLHPISKSASLTDNWQEFAKGKTLCNIGWGGSQKYFVREAANFAAGITATQLPGIRTAGKTLPLPYFNWGWNLVVPQGAKQPELGFLLAAFATVPEVSTQAVAQKEGFFDPFQPAHYTSSDIREAYGEQFLDIHKTGMGAAIPDLYIRGYSQYIDALSTYLVRADRGFITPYEAMQAVSTRWQFVTQSLGQKQQLRQWLSLLTNYPSEFLAALE